MDLRFSHYSASDRGLVRDGNEDSALISSRLIAVADGMGGHAGGEVASKIAITTLAALSPVLSDQSIDAESREDLLMNITYSIDQELASAVVENQSLTGMGTTLTALYLQETTVELLHIGDSRCYIWNGKKLEQLSYDHTVMQELLDQGRLTPDEVHTHPQRSMLTQALMGEGRIDPILNIFPAKIGDHFLLCSDGVTNVLSNLEITQIIKSHEGDELVAALISAVHAKGAPDNATVIWAEIVAGGAESAVAMIGAAGGAE
jgi:serine/threonine protein phosphatase PrpC